MSELSDISDRSDSFSSAKSCVQSHDSEENHCIVTLDCSEQIDSSQPDDTANQKTSVVTANDEIDEECEMKNDEVEPDSIESEMKQVPNAVETFKEPNGIFIDFENEDTESILSRIREARAKFQKLSKKSPSVDKTSREDMLRKFSIDPSSRKQAIRAGTVKRKQQIYNSYTRTLVKKNSYKIMNITVKNGTNFASVNKKREMVFEIDI